ncbi:MAG: transposase [Oscillospiraceae bacterium]
MSQEENSKRRRKDKTAKVQFKPADKLTVPENIRITYWPPRTPEMNPIEIIWREIRKRGFKNILFNTLKDVVTKFNNIVVNFPYSDVISITRWKWIDEILNQVI